MKYHPAHLSASAVYPSMSAVSTLICSLASAMALCFSSDVISQNIFSLQLGFLCMGFLIHGPGGAVKLYFSLPVRMYTVFLRPSRTVHCIFGTKNPGKNPGHNPGQKPGQQSDQNLAKNLVKNLVKIWPISRHSDHVLKTQVYSVERFLDEN